MIETCKDAKYINGAPWPIVDECQSFHNHSLPCPQWDHGHEHRWIAWHDAPALGGPGIPVRCTICGGRKCDTPDCMLQRHHNSDHLAY